MFSENEIFLNRGFKRKKNYKQSWVLVRFFLKKRSGFLSGNNVLWFSLLQNVRTIIKAVNKYPIKTYFLV